jgi:phage tail sheath gpL-like
MKSCCNVVWESGTVSATVGGVTFSTSYAGSTPTSASVATGLANAMNVAGSPVSATVNSSVITVTSKVNGAVTDYSLYTSYTYDTTNFTSPAFTAAASGSTLTGGTD